MDPDPWNWTVEEVVQYFRDDAARHVTDIPHGRLPQIDTFTESIRENDANGFILLTAIDAAALRDDFGIKSLNVRGTVIHCILKLRRQSVIYVAQHDEIRLQTPSSWPARAFPAIPEQEAVQALPSTETIREQVRSGELEIQDDHGRKRRKLNVDKIQNIPPPENPDPTKAYFGDKRLHVDEIFYGPTQVGGEVQDLQPIGDVLVFEGDGDAESDDGNFQFQRQHKLAGETQYVYSQVRHFLQAAEVVDLRRQDREAIGILPYRSNIDERSRSATVLQFRHGKEAPVAVRERAAHLDSGYNPDESTLQPPGEWDFLMRKYNDKEHDTLPVYGESDSDETEGSTISSDSNDDEEAAEEDDVQTIDPSRAAEIIDRYVEDHASDWRNDLPKLEARRAWSVWKQMRQSRTLRDMLIEAAHNTVDRLTLRLAEMKDRFLRSTWESEQELIKYCVSMEPTIEDREQQRWKITVWKRRQEPEHTVSHGKAGKPTSKETRTVPGERRFTVHPNDRFSVSPVPAADNQLVEDEEQIMYEADDEELHATSNSPELPPVVDSDSDTTLDDIFVVPDESEHSFASKKKLVIKLPVNQPEHVRNAKTNRDDDEEGAYVPDDEDLSESEDLPSPSTFTKRTKQSLVPTTPTKSRTDVVDLTMLSSDSSTPMKPGRPTSATKKRVVPSGDPLTATAAEVLTWDFEQLIKGNNRLAILIRLLFEAGRQFRERLDQAFKSLRRLKFNDQLEAALQSVRHGSTAETGLNPDLAETMTRAARVYMQWAVPSSSMQGIKPDDTSAWKVILDATQIELFTNMLLNVLQKRSTKLFEQPTPTSSKGHRVSNSHSLSSSEEVRKLHLTPHSKRKKEVKRSTAAENSRKLAFDRQTRFAESQTADSSKLERMLSDPNHSSIEINPAKKEEDDPVYISVLIARRMKTHQIDGVRFLWREITGDGQDGSQGCILAHTMGLGKTMQTIAFLVSLNGAARSRKSSVYGQLPPHLRPDGIRKRQLRILVICPPALIQNWVRELDQWAPNQLGRIFSIDSASRNSRNQQLTEWMRTGGVVLIGYTVFRNIVAQKLPNQGRRKQPFSENERAAQEELAAELRSMLLDGPEIVVADEAQAFKNNKTGIAKAVKDIDTESRIALSGTPMSNSVDEIYAMVTWVAPGYLGDEVEFKAHYAEPIAEGLYADSSHYERRKSIMKLKVLHADIEPKVNRANIEVLRGSLKSKVEFIITVPLSKTQVELYRRYIKLLVSGGRSEKVKETTVFGWLAYLTLLTNHPWCFRQKLLTPAHPPKRNKRKNQIQGQPDAVIERSGAESPNETDSGSATPLGNADVDDADERPSEELAVPTDESPEDLQITQDMVRDILAGFEEVMDPSLSSKMTVFLNLLSYSLDCGDKTLVFTSSIPTLEYLDKLFTDRKKPFGRIDGSVVIAKRSQILENFRNGDFNILLVSTRAGGVGLNVQAANRVFIFDFGFNPTVEEQAVGRAYRIGQTKSVYVYRFMAGGTFETNIYNKQLFKSSLAQRVVDKKNPRRNAERNTREYLYEPKSVPQDDIREWVGKDPHVLDRLLERHGPGQDGKIDTMIRTIKTMETLQEEVVETLDENEMKEVNLEIEQGRNRPRGRKAANVVGPGPGSGLVPSTAPVKQQPGATAFPPLLPHYASRPPPPSTIAGPSNSYRSMGGLPVPKGPQPPSNR